MFKARWFDNYVSSCSINSTETALLCAQDVLVLVVDVKRATTAVCATRAGEATSSASAGRVSPAPDVTTGSTPASAIPASTTGAAAHERAVPPAAEAVATVDGHAAVVDVGNTVEDAGGHLTCASAWRDSGELVVSSAPGRARPIRASEAPSAKRSSAAKDTLVSLFTS